MHTVALTSSDGRFNVSVAGNDTELIASMLLLLEVPRLSADLTEVELDDIAERREPRHLSLAAPAA